MVRLLNLLLSLIRESMMGRYGYLENKTYITWRQSVYDTSKQTSIRVGKRN